MKNTINSLIGGHILHTNSHSQPYFFNLNFVISISCYGVILNGPKSISLASIYCKIIKWLVRTKILKILIHFSLDATTIANELYAK